MNWLECLLILAGASMEIFAAMICHGSVIQKVNIKEMSIICAVITIGQTFAIFLGYLASSWFFQRYTDLNRDEIGELLASAMMFIMGIRLIVKAVLGKTMVERLEKKFEVLKFVRLTLYTAGYTLLSGMVFGCMSTNLLLMFLLLISLMIAGTIAGIYIGYYYGFELKTWAYVAGAVLFWCSSGVLIMK